MNNTNCPPLLYKYLPPKRTDFFTKKLLRFTPIRELNDPFECLPTCRNYYSVDLINLYIEYREQDRRRGITTIPKGLTLDVIYFCDQHYDARDPEKSYALILKYNELYAMDCTDFQYNYSLADIGILSLSENYGNILMWSHYCKDHQGIVVGLHSNHNFFKIAPEFLESHDGEGSTIEIQAPWTSAPYDGLNKVIYSKSRAFAYVKGIENINEELPDADVILKKSQEWKYEQEWRYVLPSIEMLMTKNNIFGLKEVPVSAIASIYIGLKAAPSTKSKAINFCRKNPHIKLYEMTMHRTDFRLVPIKIRT